MNAQDIRLIDLVKVWADSKNYWSYLGANYGNVPYINICKSTPPNTRKIVTVWNTGVINFGKNQINPADPNFFPNIERLLSR